MPWRELTMWRQAKFVSIQCPRKIIATQASRSVAMLWLLAMTPLLATGQEPEAYFRQNCFSCHTIGGGRRTGPDLQSVTERQSREWLLGFIQNPQAVIESGDAYARKLFEEAGGALMSQPPRMTPQLAESLLQLIEEESAKEESQFHGVQISDEPFTPADIEHGLELFTGRQAFAQGAPACISCHTMPGVGVLGGGRLGPDLTRAYERLQGRNGLGTWLMVPPMVTMQALFGSAPLQTDEILGLVALMEDRARAGGESPSVAILNFSLLGLGGAALFLALIDRIWRRRLRGIRRALIGKEPSLPR